MRSPRYACGFWDGEVLEVMGNRRRCGSFGFRVAGILQVMGNPEVMQKPGVLQSGGVCGVGGQS